MHTVQSYNLDRKKDFSCESIIKQNIYMYTNDVCSVPYYLQTVTVLIRLFLVVQVRDSVPLTLYSNGILMFGGPFRPFSDPVTQVSVYCNLDQLSHCP